MAEEYSNMFDQDQLNQMMETNKEEQKKLKQKTMPPGFHVLILEDVELEKTKTNNDPMYVITVKKKEDPKEELRPVKEYLVISENGLKTKQGHNQNLYNFVSFFVNCFKFVPKDIDNDDPIGDLLLKVKKYKGKEFRGVIMHEQSLNSNKTAKFISAKLVTKRSGNINDTAINEETVPKTTKKLSPKDQAILDGRILPDNVQPKVTDNHGTPDVTDDPGDDLPF